MSITVPIPPLTIGASPQMLVRQHQWRTAQWTLAALIGLGLVLIANGVWQAVRRELPNQVMVAKYHQGKPDTSQPQDLRNTWQALPGCVRLADGSHWPLDTTSAVACDGPATPITRLPPGLDRLSEVLATWRRSDAATQAPARAQGQTAPQGRAVRLTIEPKVQDQAQTFAECFTGQEWACITLGVNMQAWRDHYEGAAARSTGVLIMDVPTGAIEAMASAFSPCYEADHSSSEAREVDCPALPQQPAPRPYMISSRGLAEAMQASTDKPVLALALLRDPILGQQLMRDGPRRAQFLQAIKHSDSAWFLDHIFCKDLGFPSDCKRAAAAQQAALDLGLNTDCTSNASASDGPTQRGCGRLNLIGDGRIGNYPVQGGRLFVQAKKGETGKQHFELMSPSFMRGYSGQFAARCSAQKWEKCTQGASFIDLMSEAYGQGNSLASPVGVANMLARLARAANSADGRSALAVQPHLVVGSSQPDIPPLKIDPAHARLILEGMSQTHQPGGSAYLACLRANGNQAKACLHQRVAGKTGTPQFRHHSLTVAQRRALCQSLPPGNSERAHCAMSPMKWYAAAVKSRSEPGAPWDKVVVVLSERNYNQRTGLVDSPLDRGTPNVSAELALRLIDQLYLNPNPDAQ